MTSKAGKRQAWLKATCVVALSLAAVGQLAALERYIGTSWTRKDGLPSTLIYALAQTRDGYLWLGTSDGLVRFDGIDFVHQRLFSEGRLLLGPVTALCAGQDGSLWVGSSSGVVMRMSAALRQKYRLSAEIKAIVEAPGNHVWVMTQNGLYQLGPSSQGELSLQVHINPAQLTRLLASGADEISLGPTLLVRSGDTPARYARKLFLSSGAIFLKGGKDGVSWLDRRPPAENSGIALTLRDKRGFLWAAGPTSGLLRTDPGARQAEPALTNDLVESLLEDHEGNLWAGTNNGLFRFRFGKASPMTKQDGLSSDLIYSVETTGSTVWVGTQNGLDRIDHLHVQQLLPGLNTMVVRAVGNRQVWAGTGEGVFAINTAEDVSKPQCIIKDLTTVIALEQGCAGCVWLLDARKGLYLWKDGALFPMESKWDAGVRTISAIRARNDDGLWVGFADGGLGIYKEGSFHELSRVAGSPQGMIYDIAVEKDDTGESGAAWFGTDTGLYRFDGKNFSVWNFEKGLPGDRVLWLQAAHSGDALWLGFSTGLAKVRRSDLRAGRFTQSGRLPCDFYDSGDGLFANPVRRYQASASLDTEEKLWFATSAGIAVMDLRHLEKNGVPPPVSIEQVIADHHKMPARSLLRLPPLTRNLEIDYAGLSLTAPRKVQFRYQLEGYDKEWQNAGARRQAFYTNLSPGPYRFRVIAANDDDVWNKTGASLGFTISPAFYQTRLFQWLCLLTAGFIIWGLYRWRLQQAQAALNARFQERLAERIHLAQDLHDELLQSALGVSLQVELTDSLLEEQHAAKAPLQRALALSRALLQQGRAVLRDLREKSREASDMAKLLSSALEEAQQRYSGPDSRLIVEGPPRSVHALVANEVMQIGRQAIANAFLHAAAKRIEVYLIYRPAELCLEVRDDGCGINSHIAEAGRPGHYGLQGMRERAERIGAALVITSRQGQGTKVRVVIPGKQAYREVNS